MARFDAAAPDEAKIVALEVEAARRRYIFCWSKGVQSNRRVHAQCRQSTRVKIFLSVPAGYRCSDCSNAKIKINRKGYSFYGSSDSDVHHRACGYIYHFQNFQPEHQDFFKLLINALIGAALLFVFNFVFAGLLNLSFFYINITWLTALITGIFGVPGVVVLLIIGLL